MCILLFHPPVDILGCSVSCVKNVAMVIPWEQKNAGERLDTLNEVHWKYFINRKETQEDDVGY